MRIALIHAVQVAMGPISDAFRRHWPKATIANLLDDTLSPDRARDRDLTLAMTARIEALARYGVEIGGDGVLFTCSAFGPAIERAARLLPVPVLKPNEAMFEEALGHGRRIGMLATFAPSVATMEREFADEAARLRSDATLRTELVEGALDALKSGDATTHNRLLSDRAHTLADCDAIVLAHFSTSVAAADIRARVAVPVLTSPDAAVLKLRRMLDVRHSEASASSQQ